MAAECYVHFVTVLIVSFAARVILSSLQNCRVENYHRTEEREKVNFYDCSCIQMIGGNSIISLLQQGIRRQRWKSSNDSFNYYGPNGFTKIYTIFTIVFAYQT